MFLFTDMWYFTLDQRESNITPGSQNWPTQDYNPAQRKAIENVKECTVCEFLTACNCTVS